MGIKHIIELNGKRYDAITGKEVSPALQASKPTRKIPKQQAAKNMEGVARRRDVNASTSVQQHRPVQKSQTLMRKTVHKPVTHKLHAVATVVGTALAIKPTDISTQPTIRHKTIAKSKLIQRFSTTQDISGPSSPHTQQASHRLSHSLSKAAIQAATVVISPLDQAIAGATSHQQPKMKRPSIHNRFAGKLHVSPKAISGGALALLALIAVGFFGYQNVPNLKMRLASSRAGVHGSLPSYQPPGFRIGDISAQAGQINVAFSSNSDKRNFKLTQVASSWNSDTLRDKLKSNPQVTNPVEVPDRGKTLFIYNDSSATWVDGGIWYKIEGDSSLNSDQLLKLVNSL